MDKRHGNVDWEILGRGRWGHGEVIFKDDRRETSDFKLLFKAVLISEYVEFFMVQFSAFHNTLLCEPLRAH